MDTEELVDINSPEWNAYKKAYYVVENFIKSGCNYNPRIGSITQYPLCVFYPSKNDVPNEYIDYYFECLHHEILEWGDEKGYSGRFQSDVSAFMKRLKRMYEREPDINEELLDIYDKHGIGAAHAFIQTLK